jgi:uncharacterized protein YndB with AHSA1/START domain
MFNHGDIVIKGILRVLGVLVTIAIVITAIGTQLPRDHVASTSATISASREDVWQAITNVASAATWRDLQSVEIVSVGPPLRWMEVNKFGPTTFEQVEATAPVRFVARVADTDQGFGGTWTYTLVPVLSGTRVTISEKGFVSNPLFRFLGRFVFGYYGTQEDYLRALGKKYGQDITPTRL